MSSHHSLTMALTDKLTRKPRKNWTQNWLLVRLSLKQQALHPKSLHQLNRTRILTENSHHITNQKSTMMTTTAPQKITITLRKVTPQEKNGLVLRITRKSKLPRVQRLSFTRNKIQLLCNQMQTEWLELIIPTTITTPTIPDTRRTMILKASPKRRNQLKWLNLTRSCLRKS